MITIIVTIIVSALLGFGSPLNFIGANFLSGNQNISKNLFSQISSNLSDKKLSNLNPIDSLGRATAPLDAIWKALGPQIKSFLDSNASGLKGASKSSLEGQLSQNDTSDQGQGYGVIKSTFILIGNIFVAVLEIALWLLKGLLNLVT